MERFKSSFLGYNIREVNQFVDNTLREYSRILEKLKQKDAEVQRLSEEVEKYKTMGEMTDNITVASEAAMKIKSMARTEAKTIVDEAKRNASRIVNDALMEAEKISNNSEQLQRNMTAFKRRLRSAYQTQLDTIEDIEKIKLDE